MPPPPGSLKANARRAVGLRSQRNVSHPANCELGTEKGVRDRSGTFWGGLGGEELIRGPFDERCGASTARRRTGCRAGYSDARLRLPLPSAVSSHGRPNLAFGATAKQRAVSCLQRTRAPNGKGCSTATAQRGAPD